MNTNTNTGSSSRKRRPMLFRMLYVGSRFRIFAEPTRGLRHADIMDDTVYEKTCEAYSTSTKDKDKCIILYPNDLVERI